MISQRAIGKNGYQRLLSNFQQITKGIGHLKNMTPWISSGVRYASLNKYGIKGRCIPSLNLTETDITYSDLLVFLGLFLNKAKYLELVVSAGKNYAQMCHRCKGIDIYGIAIEEINPVLESIFSNKNVVWESESPYLLTNYKGNTADNTFSLTQYSYEPSNNRVFYLSGDKLRSDLWYQLKGNKFNLVFLTHATIRYLFRPKWII